MNEQLETDGRILHRLGLMLERDDHGTVQPAGNGVLPVFRCAWCDAETGRKSDPTMNETHGICTMHKAQMEASLKRLRQQEAA